MAEMIAGYFQPALAFQSTLLMLITGYWLAVILGAVGFDFIDFDLDFEIDVDADVGGFSFTGNILKPVFDFFYIGEVPIMILLSFFSLFWWFSSIEVLRMLPPDWGTSTTMVMMVPAAIGSLLLCKIILIPVAPWLSGVGKQTLDTTPTELIGRKGVVNTSEVTDQFGRVLIYQEDSDLIMDARCHPGDRLNSGDVVVVVDYDKLNKALIIEPFAEK